MPTDKTELLGGYLSDYTAEIPILRFVLCLILAAVLSWALGVVYRRFGTSLSNRRQFSQNFVMLATTTMIIITIVKASLALSLGLVGALSIVRFRAAIKEPEELTYLFLCIAIGLGFGADQWQITLIGFAIIVVLIAFRYRSRRQDENQNLSLTIASEGPSRISLEQMLTTLKKYCQQVSLTRFDDSPEMFEATLQVEFSGVDQLEKCKSEFRTLDGSVSFSFFNPLPA